jgi:hypothetical protein
MRSVADDTTVHNAAGELRRVLRDGGCLALITALGDGADLEPVPYAPDIGRWYFYRDAGRLRDELAAAGLRVLTATQEYRERHWLKILAEALPATVA